jgi:hypothetical protein
MQTEHPTRWRVTLYGTTTLGALVFGIGIGLRHVSLALAGVGLLAVALVLYAKLTDQLPSSGSDNSPLVVGLWVPNEIGTQPAPEPTGLGVPDDFDGDPLSFDPPLVADDMLDERGFLPFIPRRGHHALNKDAQDALDDEQALGLFVGYPQDVVYTPRHAKADPMSPLTRADAMHAWESVRKVGLPATPLDQAQEKGSE